MLKWLLPSLLAITVPITAHAEPEPAQADVIELPCENPGTCAAVEFADALASQPPESQVERLGSVVAFEPGRVRVYSKDRENLMALAASWREHIGWATITVEGHAGVSSTAALAQRRADKIRDYLIRYGVAAEYVVAIAHEHVRGDARNDRVSDAHVDLAIERCNRSLDQCRLKPVKARSAAASTTR
jgi:hypothetical protein